MDFSETNFDIINNNRQIKFQNIKFLRIFEWEFKMSNEVVR